MIVSKIIIFAMPSSYRMMISFFAIYPKSVMCMKYVRWQTLIIPCQISTVYEIIFFPLSH
jgi:hypothetical protein